MEQDKPQELERTLQPARKGVVIVVVLTVLATLLGAFYGIAFFPGGTYPRIVLALPGLAAGGVVYFIGMWIVGPVDRLKEQNPPNRDPNNRYWECGSCKALTSEQQSVCWNCGHPRH